MRKPRREPLLRAWVWDGLGIRFTASGCFGRQSVISTLGGMKALSRSALKGLSVAGISLFLLVAALPHLYNDLTKVERTFFVSDAPAILTEERALGMARQLIALSGLRTNDWIPRRMPDARAPDCYFHRNSATSGLLYFTNAMYQSNRSIAYRCRIVWVSVKGTNATSVCRIAL